MFKKRRIKRRRRKYNKKTKPIPFVKIFELHKKGCSITDIARKLKIKRDIVHPVIRGGITIPESEIDKIKELGFKICSCCNKRIVPIETIGYSILTRLCKKCYTSEMSDEDNEYSVNLFQR